MRYFKFSLPLFLIVLFSFSTVSYRAKMSKKAYRSFEKTNPEFVFVPGGIWTSPNGRHEKGSMVHDNKWQQNVTQSFWMSKYEVTNARWQEFVKDIRQRHGFDSAKSLLPDTNLWTGQLLYNEPMREYYYRHPAYKNYPVVNISITQSEAFCRWLGKRIQSSESGAYLDSVVVRLPTDLEWEYAASGVQGGSTYPWGTDHLRNAKGVFMANFRLLPINEAKKEDGKIKLEVDYSTSNPDFTTAPVDMYGSNELGLCQMGGNVAEFVTATKESKVESGQGVSCGGSFYDPPYYMQCHARDYYPADSSAHFTRGLRPVITFRLRE